MSIRTEGLDHIAIAVSDLDRDDVVGAPGILHFAFRVDRESFEVAQTELSQRGIEFRFSDHGAAHSVYFSDPDGHRLELTTYEV